MKVRVIPKELTAPSQLPGSLFPNADVSASYDSCFTRQRHRLHHD